MAKQAAEAGRAEAVRLEIKRQQAQAQVLQAADLDEDMKLALALSRAEYEGVQGVEEGDTSAPGTLEAGAVPAEEVDAGE